MPHPMDVYIGRQLKQRRMFLGLTQENIAESIGVTFQQLQKYERGTNRISGSRLYDISRVLKVLPGYFFEGFESEAQQSAGMAEEGDGFDHDEDVITDRESLDLMKAYQQIGPSTVRRKLLKLIQSGALGDEECLDLVGAYWRIKDVSMREKLSDLVRISSQSGRRKRGRRSSTG